MVIILARVLPCADLDRAVANGHLGSGSFTEFNHYERKTSYTTRQTKREGRVESRLSPLDRVHVQQDSLNTKDRETDCTRKPGLGPIPPSFRSYSYSKQGDIVQMTLYHLQLSVSRTAVFQVPKKRPSCYMIEKGLLCQWGSTKVLGVLFCFCQFSSVTAGVESSVKGGEIQTWYLTATLVLCFTFRSSPAINLFPAAKKFTPRTHIINRHTLCRE